MNRNIGKNLRGGGSKLLEVLNFHPSFSTRLVSPSLHQSVHSTLVLTTLILPLTVVGLRRLPSLLIERDRIEKAFLTKRFRRVYDEWARVGLESVHGVVHESTVDISEIWTHRESTGMSRFGEFPSPV